MRLSMIIAYSLRIVNKYSLFLYRNMILWVYAAIAQLVERIHGKDEVTGSSPVRGSIFCAKITQVVFYKETTWVICNVVYWFLRFFLLYLDLPKPRISQKMFGKKMRPIV